MPDPSDELPTSRVVRWIALAVVMAVAVALYFREGRRLLPLTAPPPTAPPAADTAR
jgi:hypothetical protein